MKNKKIQKLLVKKKQRHSGLIETPLRKFTELNQPLSTLNASSDVANESVDLNSNEPIQEENREPRIAITTSIKFTSNYELLNQIKSIFSCEFIQRRKQKISFILESLSNLNASITGDTDVVMNTSDTDGVTNTTNPTSDYEIGAQDAKNNTRFSHLIVLNEDRKKPTRLDIYEIGGKSFKFKLINFKLNAIKVEKLNQELILNNFKNIELGRLFKGMFATQPEFEKRVVSSFTFKNGFIFYRRHRYMFCGGKCDVQELGPRLSLKLCAVDDEEIKSFSKNALNKA